MTTDHPIVVGVDAGEASRDAVRWAAAEARLRGCGVLMAHAYASREDTPQGEEWASQQAQELLDRAAADASAPGVELMRVARAGRAPQMLIDLSATARMIVVGQHGHDGRAPLLGSVAGRAAAHARCPVVVVRRGAADVVTRRGLVVVGVDGSMAGDAALGWAFEEADLRGGTVSVVHSWWPPQPPPRAFAPAHETALAGRVEEQQVAEWVRPWRDKHPTVAVRINLPRHEPGAALVEAAAEAELLVVGSRGHGGFAGLLLGSVSQHVIHRAACPVMIVR